MSADHDDVEAFDRVFTEHHVGQEVLVIYDPDAPDHAKFADACTTKIDEARPREYWSLTALTLTMVLLGPGAQAGAAVWVWASRRRDRISAPAAWGLLVMLGAVHG